MAAKLRMLYETRWSDLIIDAPLLRRFAEKHNWDDGVELLRRAIRHDQCTLATALIIYWMGGPHYFRQYAKKSDALDHERPAFSLLRAIEKKVKADGFNGLGSPFDPRRYKRHDWTRDEYPEFEKNRVIPPQMYVAVRKSGAHSLI